MKRVLLLMALALMAMPAMAKDAVAVLYFEYSGADPEMSALKVGLAQMMITDLSGDAEYVVVERARVQALLDELELGHSGIADPNSAAKIGKLLGAKYMVMGGYFPLLGQLTVHSQVVRVETTEIVGAIDVRGPIAEFAQLEAEAADFTKRSILAAVNGRPQPIPGNIAPVPAPAPMGTPEPAEAAPRTRDVGATGAVEPSSAPAIIAPDPVALDAAVAFSNGLIFLDAGEGANARESFQKALAKSEDFDEAKKALAALDL